MAPGCAFIPPRRWCRWTPWYAPLWRDAHAATLDRWPSPSAPPHVLPRPSPSGRPRPSQGADVGLGTLRGALAQDPSPAPGAQVCGVSPRMRRAHTPVGGGCASAKCRWEKTGIALRGVRNVSCMGSMSHRHAACLAIPRTISRGSGLCLTRCCPVGCRDDREVLTRAVTLWATWIIHASLECGVTQGHSVSPSALTCGRSRCLCTPIYRLPVDVVDG
jgi:hypothetical protein